MLRQPHLIILFLSVFNGKEAFQGCESAKVWVDVHQTSSATGDARMFHSMYVGHVNEHAS